MTAAILACSGQISHRPEQQHFAWMQRPVDTRMIPAKFSNQGSPEPETPQFGLSAVDHARLHHERDAFEDADVFQGIARDSDDVGIVAGLERAELVLPIE
jgi:hypothetical protein